MKLVLLKDVDNQEKNELSEGLVKVFIENGYPVVLNYEKNENKKYDLIMRVLK